jgi:LysM repeat protein
MRATGKLLYKRELVPYIMVEKFGSEAVPPVSFRSQASRHSRWDCLRRPLRLVHRRNQRMKRLVIAATTGFLFLGSGGTLDAQTLRGSPQAMQKQNRVAREHDYTFLQTSAQVRQFVEMGLLVRLPGNANYQLASVSHPYARPAVKLFVERLSAQYRAACGEKLVVTSLTRPAREQPRNASHLSVHPAGMAVDLRVSGKAACRTWLERTLISLERQGVLDAIRENRPPHYHVALFPEPYTRYVARVTNGSGTQLATASTPAAPASTASAARRDGAPLVTANLPARQGASGPDGAAIAAALESSPEALANYRVNRGDTLWSIARRHGTTVEALQRLNGIRNSRIVPGQVIAVPSAAAEASSP